VSGGPEDARPGPGGGDGDGPGPGFFEDRPAGPGQGAPVPGGPGGAGGQEVPATPPIPDDFGRPSDPGVVPTSQFVADPGDGGAGEARLTRAQLQARARGESVSGAGGPDDDGEWDDRSVLRRHPFRILGFAFVLLGLVVIVGGYLWVDHQANPSGPKGAQVIVTVPKGSGTSQFAGVLAEKGVIGSSFAFRLWSKFHGAPTIYAGAYAFNRNDSFADINTVLGNGPNVFSLDVPPGFTVSELAARVGQFPGHDETTFAKLATSGTLHSPWQPVGVTSLEGLLGTGTYQLVPGETDTQLLTDMIDRFDAQANAMDLTAEAAAVGLTPYQAVTVASIVEKEGVIQKNLGPVARVILNRLARNMPLQMDSTVLYAEGRDGGKVTSKDLALASPYNTYLNKGLTPTPVCFPSPAALHAALNPPAGSWLYFVVVEPDGTEAFADTYAQQQANEAVAAQRGLS